MEKSLIDLLDRFNTKRIPAAQYSPQVLAYIGDSVFDIVIRNLLVARANAPVNNLNHHASMLVRASAQSQMIDIIMPMLTEKEISVFRRGKNSKPATTAKNASVKDYLRASGFEALIGYLYLNDEDERMMDLIYTAVTQFEAKLHNAE